MAVGNFKPILWAKRILKKLDKEHMLVKHCTTSYSGEISGIGSKVKINSILSPTIGDYVPNVTSITPEELIDESRMLEITEAKYFAFYLDDVDAKQASGGLLEEGLRKAVISLNDTAEAFIAAKYSDAGTTVTATVTSANILSTLLSARTKLRENNVGSGMEVYLEVTPDVYQKIQLAGIVQTDSRKEIQKGVWSEVLQMDVFISNNLSKVGSLSHCIMRTKEAIAFAEQIMKVKKYEPENAFSEAVKGLHVYGAKVIKPEEMVHLALTTDAETTI